eukprot:CAMPEP_0170528718 /NCGR_PEP_ID=MMETSP0209-20121228/14206_1 /TAXON_ID=665100 ORGANISM="Litonotus pictus, Strain P1" /NCGR_SAMPLE_ID=MMETSP0209 /ASSEMBLY_ACC=CAM_ASM_000301 /LENGTH=526 /DNA_ID=CAMNT_0010820107 /DNA_START=65 /DNA_END=1645 /DNA_ORIENTATION=+
MVKRRNKNTKNTKKRIKKTNKESSDRNHMAQTQPNFQLKEQVKPKKVEEPKYELDLDSDIHKVNRVSILNSGRDYTKEPVVYYGYDNNRPSELNSDIAAIYSAFKDKPEETDPINIVEGNEADHKEQNNPIHHRSSNSKSNSKEKNQVKYRERDDLNIAEVELKKDPETDNIFINKRINIGNFGVANRKHTRTGYGKTIYKLDLDYSLDCFEDDDFNKDKNSQSLQDPQIGNENDSDNVNKSKIESETKERTSNNLFLHQINKSEVMLTENNRTPNGNIRKLTREDLNDILYNIEEMNNQAKGDDEDNMFNIVKPKRDMIKQQGKEKKDYTVTQATSVNKSSSKEASYLDQAKRNKKQVRNQTKDVKNILNSFNDQVNIEDNISEISPDKQSSFGSIEEPQRNSVFRIHKREINNKTMANGKWALEVLENVGTQSDLPVSQKPISNATKNKSKRSKESNMGSYWNRDREEEKQGQANFFCFADCSKQVERETHMENSTESKKETDDCGVEGFFKKMFKNFQCGSNN